MTTAGPPERDALIARIEALEHAHKPQSLWKNTALVGLIGTLVAVIPPSLTAIHEYYQTEREVRLSLAKYQHERTLSYLDRALSPETEEAKQAQVFRFLRHLPQEDPVRQWAEEELTIVQQSISKLEQQIAANEERLRQLEQEKRATLDQTVAVIEAAAPKEEVDTVVQAAQLEVDSYQRKIEQIQAETNSLKVRTGDALASRAEPAAAGFAPEHGMADVPTVAPTRVSQWRLQIGTALDLESALDKAHKARDAGQPDVTVYRKGSLFYVMVGRFASWNDAHGQSSKSRGSIRGLSRPVDIADWCSSQRPQPDYVECIP